MAILSAKLVEVIQLGTEIAGLIDLPVKYWPLPGQYLPCQRLDGDMDGLATPLFPVLVGPNRLALGALPATWQPGDLLACTPPQGHGFHLPGSARRVGLVPYGVSPHRLLTLVPDGLAQQAAVSLFTDRGIPEDVLARVPSQVEVLPLAALVEEPGWPDYLAVDVDRSGLTTFIDQVAPHTWRCEAEVLIFTPMPCRGVGECGVCAVRTRRGWRYVCADGPVFPLKEVVHVAR